MKDHFKTLLVFLSLGSIIIVLNNCGDFKANQILDEDNQVLRKNSIFQKKSLNKKNNNLVTDEFLENGTKKVSEHVDVDLYIDTMYTFMGLIDKTTTKEDLVSLLKNYNLGLSQPQHISGLADKITIKTRKQFNGMKHIRATFISDNGDNERFMRLSYDLPKSETGLSDTARILENTFPEMVRRETDTNDQYLIRYDIGEYELSLRQNFWDDLLDNPFNPYTKDHIGTVTVILEYSRH